MQIHGAPFGLSGKKSESSERGIEVRWDIGDGLSKFLAIVGISPSDIQQFSGNQEEAYRGLGLSDWIRSRQEEHEWIYLRDDVADVFVRKALAELTDQELFVLAEAGERELVDRAGMAEDLVREITGDSSFRLVGSMSGKCDYLSASEMMKFLSILPQIESWRTDLPLTLRNIIRKVASRIDDERSQAMTADELERFGLERNEEYMRGTVYLDPVYIKICKDLLEHYGIESLENGHVWITNKGIWSQQIALEGLSLGNKESSVIFVGKAYFEVNKRFARIDDVFGTNLSTRITRTKDESDLAERMNSLENDLIIYFDPLESYPQCGVRDADVIIKTAIEYQIRTGKSVTIIMDVTTCAGVYPNIEELKRKYETLPNIVLAQSFLKFWELGTDLTQIGAILVYGPDGQPDGEIYKQLMKYYYLVHADPQLDSLAKVPPIRSDYMEYRANRVSRNMRLITSCLEEELSECSVNVEIMTHRKMNEEVVDKIGFEGPYFFIAFPSGEVAEKFIQEVEKFKPNAIGTIDSGVSFGFDKTRAWHVGNTRYVRVVCGTEDILTAYIVQKRLLACLNSALS